MKKTYIPPMAQLCPVHITDILQSSRDFEGEFDPA